MIRKMVGLTMAIVRGYAEVGIMDRAFGPAKVDVPRAPGLGLLLDSCFFDVYNKKYKGDPDHPPIGWPELDPVIEQFKRDKIFSEMVKTEMFDRTIFTWCNTIKAHNFAAAMELPTAAEAEAAAAAAAPKKKREPTWSWRGCYSALCTSDGRCYSTVCQRHDLEIRKRKRFNARGFGTMKRRKRQKKN